MAPAEIAALVRDVQQTTTALIENDDQSKRAALAAARNIDLECLPGIYTFIRLGIDLELWAKICAGDGKPRTIEELAKDCGCESALLARVMKHLATGGIVDETGPDVYAPNGVSFLLATPEGAGMVVNCFDASMLVNAKLCDFFKKTKYANPIDKDASPFQYAFDTKQHYFEWVFAPGNELQVVAFKNHMKIKTLGNMWYQGMNVDELFSDFDASKSDVVMVDVGGSTGKDVLGFAKAVPQLKGRFVVQDLPAVIKTLDECALRPVEAMEHDFFTPQPIKGAKSYYMKMVLHDWPDSSATRILEDLAPALTPGYSRILINEIVIPETNADWYSTSVDYLMMVVLAAQERREEHWRELIEGVKGLRLKKIWKIDGASEQLLEVERLA